MNQVRLFKRQGLFLPVAGTLILFALTASCRPFPSDAAKTERADVRRDLSVQPDANNSASRAQPVPNGGRLAHLGDGDANSTLIAASSRRSQASPTSDVLNETPGSGIVIPESQIPNFHVVYPFLLRGAAPTDAGLHRLKALGVQTVIDLRISPKQVATERREVEALGMRFLNLPMSGDPPTTKEVRTFLETTSDPSHPTIFVHCQHGSDRTGTMIGIYREQVDGWDFDRTYREMRRYGFDPHWRKLTQTVRSYLPLSHSVGEGAGG